MKTEYEVWRDELAGKKDESWVGPVTVFAALMVAIAVCALLGN
jgi:hypothetical protein